MKIVLNLNVSLGDLKYIAGLNVGNEQGELAIKVQQQNPEQIMSWIEIVLTVETQPEVPSNGDPVLCEGVGDPGFDCVLVNAGS